MKNTELPQKAEAGLLTGRFQSYKAEQTEKFGCNEKYGVLVGDQVLHFTVWTAKGTKLADIKRPVFADKPGTLVAVIEPTIKIDGKYLRTGASGVELIEK